MGDFDRRFVKQMEDVLKRESRGERIHEVELEIARMVVGRVQTFTLRGIIEEIEATQNGDVPPSPGS
jgi:hypothetical protein